MMTLKIKLPSRTLFEKQVHQVTIEALNGAYCLLPRHIDFVTALPPGLLTCIGGEDEEYLFAVNSGIVVKTGPEVLVSVSEAVAGADLEHLRETVDEQFKKIDQQERRALTAMSRIEAGMVRRFVEMQRDVV